MLDDHWLSLRDHRNLGDRHRRTLHGGDDFRSHTALVQIDDVLRGERAGHSGGANVVLDESRIDAGARHGDDFLHRGRADLNLPAELSGNLRTVLCLNVVDRRADGRTAQGADAGADQRSARRVADSISYDRAHAGAAQGAETGAAIGIERRLAAYADEARRKQK